MCGTCGVDSFGLNDRGGDHNASLCLLVMVEDGSCYGGVMIRWLVGDDERCLDGDNNYGYNSDGGRWLLF